MGNTQSSESADNGQDYEYERRGPAKLVKPRIDPNTDDMHFFSSSSTPGLILAGGHPARRYTLPAGQSPSVASFDHYMALPTPTRESSSTALNLLSGGREPLSDAGSRRDSMAEETQRKDRNRRSIFRSKSSSVETGRSAMPERRNTILASPTPPLPPIEGQGVALPSKRMSWYAGPSDSAYLEEAPPDNSWHVNDNRTSWHYDLTSYDAKRLLNLVQETGEASRYDEESVKMSGAASDRRFSIVSETTWKSSHPAQAGDNSPISRVNSDLSMYTPVRRRSVIQTPGVATRRNSSRPPSISYRFSHPPTPSNLSRQPSLEFDGRAKSMLIPLSLLPDSPPLPHGRDPDEPLGLVTPCEGDYQTIGAFKLGTLRITNGCASPAPASPEPKEEHMIQLPALAHPSLQQMGSGYFIGKPAPISKDGDVVSATEGLIGAEFVVFGTGTDTIPTRADSGNSSGLQATSKTNAMDDNLFDDDIQQEYSTVEKLDLRLDPNAKREAQKEEKSQWSARGIARSDSGFVSSPTSEYPTPKKALSKTDSGYSSNISLRSLRDGSTKSHGDSDRSWTLALRRMSSAGSAVEPPIAELKLGGPPETFNANLVTEPERSPPPPPPPPKDFPRSSPPREDIRLNAARLETRPHTANAANSLTSKSRTWEVVPLSSEAPSSPLSASSENFAPMSIGSSTLKPGRLQRFLSIGSSSRSKPLTAHNTHAAEEFEIPPVPRQMRRNLRTHSGLFPMTTKRLAIRPQRSRDTLKTIISVGSLEMHSGTKEYLPYIASSNSASSSTVGSQSIAADRRHTFTPSSLGQVTSAEIVTVDEAEEAIAPVPQRTMSIPRKPVPTRAESMKRLLTSQFSKATPEVAVNKPLTVDTGNLGYAAGNNGPGSIPYDAKAQAITEESRMHGLFSSPTSGTKSLTSQAERSWSIKNWASPSPTLSSFGARDSAAPTSPSSIPTSPLVPELMRKKKNGTPPPVSMMTRNQTNMRVPQPLRTQSTPTVDAEPRVVAGASRRATSHDVLRQHQQEQFIDNHEPLPLSFDATPATLTRRSMAPDWAIITDHGSSQNRRLSIGQQPNFEFSPVELLSDSPPRRPSTSGTGAHPRPASGSRRSATEVIYSDEFAFLVQDPTQANQQRVSPKPSSSVADPRWNRPSQQFQQHWEQKDQQLGGRYHPYVPRGHSRNRSLSATGPPVGQPAPGVPYRILHSYNSPAYRNAPIWG